MIFVEQGWAAIPRSGQELFEKLHMGEFTNLACFGLEDWVRTAIRGIPDEKSAARCDQCGGCEEKCPNGIPVRENLKRLREVAGVSDGLDG